MRWVDNIGYRRLYRAIVYYELIQPKYKVVSGIGIVRVR